MKEITINTTKDQIEMITGSVFWHDVVTELEAWKEGFRREMESIVDKAAVDNPSSASVLLHMGDINGRIKAVDYLLSLPDVFLSILEEKANDAKRSRTD
jgi:hypothetical protein